MDYLHFHAVLQTFPHKRQPFRRKACLHPFHILIGVQEQLRARAPRGISEKAYDRTLQASGADISRLTFVEYFGNSDPLKCRQPSGQHCRVHHTADDLRHNIAVRGGGPAFEPIHKHGNGVHLGKLLLCNAHCFTDLGHYAVFLRKAQQSFRYAVQYLRIS